MEPAKNTISRSLDDGPGRRGVVVRGAQMETITRDIVTLHKLRVGRGPTRGKSYLLEDRYVLTVLDDVMTTAEHTLVRNGRAELVRQARQALQEVLTLELRGVVESALGREVIGPVVGQLTAESNCYICFFVLGPGAEVEDASPLSGRRSPA
jgi:uncharacterized protein YbcI